MTQPAQLVQVEAQTRALLDWTPALIKAAELNADGGNLRLAADLCESMMVDDRVSRCLGAIAGVISLPLTFDPPGDGDSETDPVSEALSRDWWKFFPESEQRSLISWGMLLGVGLPHVEDWQHDDETGRVLPMTEVWNPKNLRCDLTASKWFLRLNDNTEVEITDDSDRFWLFRPYGKRRPWAHAPWRGLARLCLLKRYALDDWAVYSEVRARGTDVITESAIENAKSVGDEERKLLASDLKAMGKNGKIVLPAGFDYKLVESSANTWATYRAQIEVANAAISINLCGGNLTSEVQGGSRAAATVHDQVEQRVIRTVSESLSTDSRQGTLVKYTEYNFGDRKRTPYAKWNTEAPADRSTRADVLVKVSQYVTNMVLAGFEPDLKQIEEEFGVTLTKGERRQVFPGAFAALPLAAGPTAHGHAHTIENKAKSPPPDNGQVYADKVCESVKAHAAKELAPTVAAMMSVIHGAKSYDDALSKIRAKYKKLTTPKDLAELTEAAYVMATLGGRLASQEEIEKD